MINKLLIILLGLTLCSCVVKNYNTDAEEADRKSKATIHWKDGTKTDIKPPVIENRP